MSWLPSSEPEPGDRKSCDALEMVVVPRMRDVGALAVRRALPYVKRRMVGPFVFLDQMGPAEMTPGTGMDVRPHPHIGLATVTYLFEGAILHRDSKGNVQEILPGAMNLMTAGRGIAHSERSPDLQRREGQRLFGIQSWVALPEKHEETTPSFQHFSAGSLPVIEDGGVRARVIAGHAFGAASPVATFSEWFYADVELAAGASAPLDPDYEERAAYIAEGEVEIAGKRFEAPRLLVFKPGERITIKATRGARLMFLGGAPLEGPRHIWWNFVSSRKERIEQAKEDWKNGRFEKVIGETEFIPLPES